MHHDLDAALPRAESLYRSRSGGLIGSMTFATVATGALLIGVPLELRQLHASPAATGVTLSMFGFGMFAFEWLWGLIADRVGYRVPLIAAHVLYAAAIVLLAFATTLPLIAAAYFIACGMMVAVGPIARSYLGTSLSPSLRARGQGLLAGQWIVAEAVGAGAGGALIDHYPIRLVMLCSAVLPLISAVLAWMVFRGYSHADRLRSWSGEERRKRPAGRRDMLAVLATTAAIVCLIEIGIGGESALLPLLVTAHLHLSPASAGAALFAVLGIAGAVLVLGGGASDRWGRKPTIVVGGAVAAAGFLAYSVAGMFTVVLVGAALRATGSSLMSPALTAWVAESAPRRRHALFLGLFGEFENLGVTIGPVLGGLMWSAFGIQAAFVAYAAAALAASAIALLLVRRPAADVRTAQAGSG